MIKSDILHSSVHHKLRLQILTHLAGYFIACNCKINFWLRSRLQNDDPITAQQEMLYRRRAHLHTGKADDSKSVMSFVRVVCLCTRFQREDDHVTDCRKLCASTIWISAITVWLQFFVVSPKKCLPWWMDQNGWSWFLFLCYVKVSKRCVCPEYKKCIILSAYVRSRLGFASGIRREE